MGKKLALTLAAVGAVGMAGVYLLTIPLLRRLPRQIRMAVDGVTTIADAVAVCRQTRLQGWELVA